MDAHERFWRIVDEVNARDRDIDLGRVPQRVPRALGGRLTLGKIRDAAGDRRINPDSGWLIGQRAIADFVAKQPEELRLEQRQLYNTLYREPWLIRIPPGGRGGVAITHVDSASNYLACHHAEAAETHRRCGGWRPPEALVEKERPEGLDGGRQAVAFPSVRLDRKA